MSASYVDGKPVFEILELPAKHGHARPGAGAQHHDQHRRRQTRDHPVHARNNSEVIYGNLLSLPVGDGMLYVEPMYLTDQERQHASRTLKKVLRRLRAELRGLRRQPGRRPGSAACNRRPVRHRSPGIRRRRRPRPSRRRRNCGGGSPRCNEAIAAMDKALADLKAAQQLRATSRRTAGRCKALTTRCKRTTRMRRPRRRQPPRQPSERTALRRQARQLRPRRPPRCRGTTRVGSAHVGLATGTTGRALTVYESDAGWSSSVARWAHNPEVTGSNPVPATTKYRSEGLSQAARASFFCRQVAGSVRHTRPCRVGRRGPDRSDRIA